MQLEKLVAFHKALADPTRIRILFLLKNGPIHGQALAEKLGVSPPTITHHMAKLRHTALVKESRQGNTIYFELDRYFFEQNARALPAALFEPAREETLLDKGQDLEHAVISRFFTKEGRLKQIPAQRKRKLIVFEHMLKGLKPGVKYPEKAINQHIMQFHEDYCTIRREFIINHFMYREDGLYELNPREMWADWRAL
ncbi:metalloregulator ArsR/SmtB family transcription factor [Sulfobacillus harzensis]|uniref:Metalloregulator ArsR/SmtB family transcription factor n=1 Tax=Sulfobacillus harzensis TaxID=2729629 RepID=A0A7Y0L196_9FIRM|nr:metalloregulator ArsR/SmtB family transcription factor [Sulfobacillus harzensis]NMP21432.1 metalloregulator ArsR/SmtB family transcription factor [Sulfobacillus harzensis]